LNDIEKLHPELNPNYVPDSSLPPDAENTSTHVSQIESIVEGINSE